MPQSMRLQALLAKVYMYMSGTFENPNKEYAQLSYNYANEVIESNQFSLLSRSTFMTYNELAPDAASQTETIFAVKFIASDWDDWGSPLGSMYAEIDGQGWVRYTLALNTWICCMRQVKIRMPARLYPSTI